MYPTISICYVLNNNEEFIKESYQNSSIIADEYIFLIDKKSNDKTLDVITNLQKGDNRIKIYVSDLDNKKEQVMKYCTKEYILLLEPEDILSDNFVLIRNVLESNEDIEAFSIKTRYYLMNPLLYDNTPLQFTPIIRLIKNREDLIIKNNDIVGFKEPIIEIEEVLIHNYKFLKGVSSELDKHLINLNPIDRENLKNLFYNGRYPLNVSDILLQPNIIRSKFKI